MREGSRRKLHSSVLFIFVMFATAMIFSVYTPSALGHGVIVQLQSDLVIIENEEFSDFTPTGPLTITGEIRSLTDSPVEAELGIYTEGSVYPEWEITSATPEGRFSIGPGEVVEFELELEAWSDGVGHTHVTLLNGDGEIFAMSRGGTVQVGEPEFEWETIPILINNKEFPIAVGGPTLVFDVQGKTSGDVPEGFTSLSFDFRQDHPGVSGSVSITGFGSIIEGPYTIHVNQQNIGEGQTYDNIDAYFGPGTKGQLIDDGLTHVEMYWNPGSAEGVAGSYFFAHFYETGLPLYITISGEPVEKDVILPPVEEETITIPVTFNDGSSVDLEIETTSSISDFTIDEESKRVSFRAEGESGTEGNTIIPISRILEGPYTVMIDGQAVEDFYIFHDEETGETGIEIEYMHNISGITITGTRVVPEFPLSLLIMAGSIGISSSLIFIFGRQRC